MRNPNRAIATLSLLLAGALSGCGTSTGNPLIILKTDNYVTASSRFLGIERLLEWLVPPAYATVSSARVCLKRVRFKPTETETYGENVDFSVGEVTLSSSGGTLEEFKVPTGIYRRIEIDISRESNCPSNESVRITNSNGTFSTQDGMTLKFSGQFVHDDGETIVLSLQALINAWNAVTSNGQIKDQAEAANGDFTEN